jgi:catechol 2,3-dioxygenase-like lactoylglutathione lyase family enzyme
MQTPKTIIQAIAEIVINVDDIDRARTFYETVLGVQLHSQFPAENPTIVFLMIAELDSPLGHGGHPQLLALIDPHRHPPAQQRFRGLDVTVSSLNHLAFEIELETYQSEKQRLEAMGLTIHEEVFPNMNAKALFFQDPEGNTLEFICHDIAAPASTSA